MQNKLGLGLIKKYFGREQLKANAVRVAVCISGQMRTYRKALPSITQHLIKPNNADVFIDTWDQAGNTNKLILLLPSGFPLHLPLEYWHAQPDLMNNEHCRFEVDMPHVYAELQSIAKADDQISLTELQELYNPKGARVEEFSAAFFEDKLDLSRLKRLFPDTTGLNAAPMFYKIHGCDQLRRDHEKREGFTYDVVIRVRPDLEFFSDLVFSKEFATDKLWTLLNPFYEVLGVADFNSNDMFFVGDSNTMTYAASLWNDLPRHWDPEANPDRNFGDRGPERLLNDHLRARDLTGSVLTVTPAPNRIVTAIDYPRLLTLLESDIAQIGELPGFVSNCVAAAQSQYAIHVLAIGDGERAQEILEQPAQIGPLGCAEPFAGRAKMASILNQPVELEALLAQTRAAGQESVFPELFAPASA
jgi:hypothetical protein